MGGFASFVGEKYGRLTLVRFDSMKRKWECQCDCGASHFVATCKLKSGNTSSCGCLRAELSKKKFQDLAKLCPAFKHGLSNSKEYSSWHNMMQRCRDKNNHKWPRYGGRGITVCKRWHDFRNFFADMGKIPSAGMSIDRINNDGNYDPSNCRWATPVQQRNNRSDSSKPQSLTAGE